MVIPGPCDYQISSLNHTGRATSYEAVVISNLNWKDRPKICFKEKLALLDITQDHQNKNRYPLGCK